MVLVARFSLEIPSANNKRVFLTIIRLLKTLELAKHLKITGSRILLAIIFVVIKILLGIVGVVLLISIFLCFLYSPSWLLLMFSFGLMDGSIQAEIASSETTSGRILGTLFFVFMIACCVFSIGAIIIIGVPCLEYQFQEIYTWIGS